jgi:hypothetical protein
MSEQQTHQPASSAPSSGMSRGLLIKIAVGIAVVIVFLIGGFFLFSNSAQSPEAAAAEETARAVEKIGMLIALPEGEEPTLATVTDPEQLKDQPFFANAQPGFQVLLYPVAQKAFLYDPERNIIVEVATLNLGQ